jgi:hypothetical protein
MPMTADGMSARKSQRFSPFLQEVEGVDGVWIGDGAPRVDLAPCAAPAAEAGRGPVAVGPNGRFPPADVQGTPLLLLERPEGPTHRVLDLCYGSATGASHHATTNGVALTSAQCNLQEPRAVTCFDGGYPKLETYAVKPKMPPDTCRETRLIPLSRCGRHRGRSRTLRIHRILLLHLTMLVIYDSS